MNNNKGLDEFTDYYVKTEYRGLVKNVTTNEYEEMFRTEISELLCRNRTAEKVLALMAKTESESYDVTDVVVEKRTVTSYVSKWEVVK